MGKRKNLRKKRKPLDDSLPSSSNNAIFTHPVQPEVAHRSVEFKRTPIGELQLISPQSLIMKLLEQVYDNVSINLFDQVMKVNLGALFVFALTKQWDFFKVNSQIMFQSLVKKRSVPPDDTLNQICSDFKEITCKELEKLDIPDPMNSINWEQFATKWFESDLKPEASRPETLNAFGIEPTLVSKTYDEIKGNEFAKFVAGINVYRDKSFKSTCLESRLDDRITSPILVYEDLFSVMVAVSGAGKTRRIYEELHAKYGIYFTCSKLLNGGSTDLEACIEMSVKDEEYERYFNLLIWSRMLIVDYLRIELGFSPSELLLAQIHPNDVFGADVFVNLFRQLAETIKPEGVSIFQTDYVVAIDEIQKALQSEKKLIYTKKNRSAFSPLFYGFQRMFRSSSLIFSGTGMSYLELKDSMGSITAKNYNYRNVIDFQPMTTDVIKNYCMRMLQSKMSSEIQQSTATLLSKDPVLNGGRPRFTAFVLDQILNGISVCEALAILNKVITDPKDDRFPIRDWKDRKVMMIGGNSIYMILRDALVSYITKGRAVIPVTSENEVADMILMGIGYALNLEFKVELVERAIVHSLFELIEMNDVASAFLVSLQGSANSSTAGFHFEYLIFFKYYLQLRNQGREVHVYQGPLWNYDAYCDKDLVLILPDNASGPDLVIKDGDIYHVFRFKFTRTLNEFKAEFVTDYQNFYLDRQMEIIPGFEKANAMCQLFFKDKKIFWYVVHQGQTGGLFYSRREFD